MNFGSLRRATSLPRGNKHDYIISYKTLVRWRFACALRGSARGFWFIDPLWLRPRGLCSVATRACHVNHAPPSYNYNIDHTHLPFNQDECNLPVFLFTIEYCVCMWWGGGGVVATWMLCTSPYPTFDVKIWDWDGLELKHTPGHQGLDLAGET